MKTKENLRLKCLLFLIIHLIKIQKLFLKHKCSILSIVENKKVID
jgi:hypothetical protein